MVNKFHPFHMVQMSPWPILMATWIFSSMLFTLIWTQTKMNFFMKTSLMPSSLVAFMWWRDVIREAVHQGYHQSQVLDGLKMSMLLFILSEVMFFLSFFWTCFHSSLSPNIEMGQNWPPLNISSFNPMNIPLLNTIILLSSGVSITWSHHSLIKNNFKKTINSIMLTVILGFYFSVLQGLEYWQAEFTMNDSVYGSIFFMSTGFHGIHVIIGSTFLLVCMIRLYKLHLNKMHFMGLEAAIWYWHFVDVVWIFLYTLIYWWGM